jgi:hypothetical protein
MWDNTVAIHGILKEKITKLNFYSTQYLKSKIDKDNFEKHIVAKTNPVYIEKKNESRKIN